MREADTVARLGGDEFVLLIGQRDAESVALVVERMLTEIGASWSIEQATST